MFSSDREPKPLEHLVIHRNGLGPAFGFYIVRGDRLACLQGRGGNLCSRDGPDGRFIDLLHDHLFGIANLYRG